MKKLFLVSMTILVVVGYVVAQWQPTNGPFSAEIADVAVSGNTLFAGITNGKVYKSTDDGVSWHETAIPCRYSISCCGNKLYSSDGNEIYVSADNGETFSTLSTSLPDDMVNYGHQVCGKTIIIISEDNGMATSVDEGQTWTKTIINTHMIYTLASLNDKLLAGTDNGLYISSDGGITWEPLGFPEESIASVLVVENKIYVGSNNSGISVSSDGGNTWNNLNNGLSVQSVSSLIVSGTDLWIVSENNVFKSDMNSVEWQQVSDNLPSGLSLRKLVALNSIIFIGTDQMGLFETSDNGLHWNHSSKGIDLSPVINVILSNKNRLYAGTQWGGLYYSDNGGANWQISSLAWVIYCLKTDDSAIYAGTSNGIYKSTDNGNTWTNLGLTNELVQSLLITNDAFYAGTERYIYKSTDKGNTWVNYSSGLPDYAGINSIAIKNNILFATTSGDGVYKKTDETANWTTTNTGLNNQYLRPLFVVDSVLFISDWWNGVYKSTDDGTTWNYSGLDGECITEFKKWGDYLFVGTWNSGIFYSLDNGLSWTPYNTDLDIPELGFNTLEIDDKYMYTGGYNTKVWKCLLPGVTSSKLSTGKSDFSIFPNPANNYLRLTGPDNLSGQACIYNSNGQWVVNQKITAGQIDIHNLKEGFYILTIHTSNNIQTIKFVKN